MTMTAERIHGVLRLLGPWKSACEVTPRHRSREFRLFRLRFVGGSQAAVKFASGSGPAAVLPVREAAVINAAGPAAGTVLGSGRLPDGGSWIATPWEQGPPLTARCAAFRAKPASRDARWRAADAAAAAARAVAALHACGWAHGDLRADHVVYTDGGMRLLDLAWAHNPRHVLPGVPAVPYAGGLVHLEPPEIAASLLDGVPVSPSAAADVYTLAAAVWASCTGAWPLDYRAAGITPASGNLGGMRRAVAAAALLRPAAGLPWPELAGVLGRAMARDPGCRPDASALARDLGLLARKARLGLPPSGPAVNVIPLRPGTAAPQLTATPHTGSIPCTR